MLRGNSAIARCATFVLFPLSITIPCVAASTEDRKSIESITIGEQVWMKRNMDVKTFRNGDPIPRTNDASAWAKAARTKTPAFTTYDNQSPPPEDWGLLYNFAAVTDLRGICPNGWRVPNNADWRELEAFLGNGPDAAQALKASSGWPGSFNGSNETGFAALPAGWRTQEGIFYLANRIAYFWTSDLSPDDTVVSHMLFDVERPMFRIGYNPGMGQSLRCIAE
jgi:uncharacterized protein (TIGR02145 family)